MLNMEYNTTMHVINVMSLINGIEFYSLYFMSL